MPNILKDNQNENCTASTSTINWLCKKISTFIIEEIFFLHWPALNLHNKCGLIYINHFILIMYIYIICNPIFCPRLHFK